MTPEQIAQIEAALEECANDLEAELESRYAGTKHYPSQLRKYERDMEPVKRAREALALLHSIKDEPSEGELTAGAKIIASDILNYSWDGLKKESVVPKGFDPFYWSSYGGRSFQGGQDDLRDITKKILIAARTARQS